MSLVCLFVVCLFVFFTSDNHLRPPFASTSQAYPLYNQAKKVISSVLLVANIKAICTSHRGYKRHPSYTSEQLRLMGSVSETIKRSMRTEHLRRTASAISVAVQQHTGMNLSFVFQLSYCLYNLTTHRRHNFSSL